MTDLACRNGRAHDGRCPLPLRDVVGAGRIHHDRNAGFLAHLRYGRSFMPAQGADDEVHLLLQRQTARLSQGLVWIARGVGCHDLDLAAAGQEVGLLPIELEAVVHVLAGRCKRTREGDEKADLDRSALCVCRMSPAEDESGKKHAGDV